MAKKKQSYEELQDAGWTEEVVYFDEPETVTTPPKPDRKVAKQSAPYVVVDNKEQIKEMSRSNEMMTDALNKMVTTMKDLNERPKGLAMKITRNASGFMDDVDVTFKY